MVNVLIGTRMQAANLERIRTLFPQVQLTQLNPQEVPSDSPQWLGALASAEAMLASYPQYGFDPALAPRLRWAHLTSAGVDKVMSKPIWHTDVAITTSSGIFNVPIAEYVLTSMLAFSRNFPELHTWQQRHSWPNKASPAYTLVNRELRGATLGVLGYGSIGREVARLGRGFAMRVLALKNNPEERRDLGWCPPGVGDPEGTIPEMIYAPAQLHEFLAQCDYVAITLPLTRHTKHIIDEAALRAMRPNAYLVNIGRGELIDEPDLIRALKERWIAGAGLDVTTIEPLPSDSELYDLPNVVLTPHYSGSSNMHGERLVQIYGENLRRYLAGEPLLNRVDRHRSY